VRRAALVIFAALALGLPDARAAGAGRAFFERFRARTGRAPHAYAIFGYEAMAVVLDAIDRAADPASRAAVVDAFFATRDRDSPLGRYSIDAFGDTTLATCGGYRVADQRIVWDRVLAGGPG
jgi:branched-chain amino acid transport system substrate-binding protein